LDFGLWIGVSPQDKRGSSRHPRARYAVSERIANRKRSGLQVGWRMLDPEADTDVIAKLQRATMIQSVKSARQIEGVSDEILHQEDCRSHA
jgi:hypothetical protein